MIPSPINGGFLEIIGGLICKFWRIQEQERTRKKKGRKGKSFGFVMWGDYIEKGDWMTSGYMYAYEEETNKQP